MRLVTKNEVVKDAFLNELKREGIKFAVTERLGYEAFIGYMIEGTLEEISNTLNSFEGEEKEILIEGFLAFKEQINHALEHLKEGEEINHLLQEGYWMGDVLEQLFKNGALVVEENKARLKEDVDVTKLKFQFRFPYQIAKNLESIEKIAKQFAFVDLLPEYEIEIRELEIEKINKALHIAAKYFEEEAVMGVYFALISRGIVANEVLNALGNEKVPKDELVGTFLKAMPMEIPTEKGTMIINVTDGKAFEEILRMLEKEGRIDIKGGKIKRR
ncbi:hypothetical protein NF865_09190 [Thermococcus aggregans]|uniref:Uncharacterized protein n=1 Tax=Thermococcus aggregans TaxID=110163 RepID=A0A9E7SNF8_THEAG|nr:hypothetical protein [Thermococcus aggregans]USS40463.1 hypothetical protein NF865_09190 [Thermococcus aggregans]